MAITQKNRAASIKTPLGSDVLVLKSLKGGQQLGRLFQFELELISEDYDIDFDKIIGEKVTISLYLGDNDTRYFNGFVSRFVQTAPEGGYARYQATVVPWLWLLTRTADCRIFQSKTIPDILEEVFKGHGFDAYERRLSGKYTPWDYCVQYRETDFNFVSRLMEQEGIYYYFKHEDGKHTLVLADSPAAHADYPGYEEIAFRPPDETDADGEYIRDWVIDKELQTGAYAHTDFNFEKPKTNLQASSNIPRQHAAADLEMFDYPGEYDASGDGEDYAKIRIQEIQARHETLHGQTDARGICSGFTFKLKDYERKDQNRKYLVTTANHAISVDVFESGGEAEEPFYECSFSAIDAAVPFRPARITPKPIVQGPQTAIVVGPGGETIYTDKYGRVKVQFHWDRHSKADANSSCWIRVSQNWGGKNWGGSFIPHVGQEVIVSFLEGDPDQPIITGRVYNADQMPPVALPAGKTQSVIRDHGGNETIMEGKDGSQFIHTKQKCGNEFLMDGTSGKEKIELRDKYGNEIVLDAVKGTLRLYSPTHQSGIVLGRSCGLFSTSDFFKDFNGEEITKIRGPKHENIGGLSSKLIGGVKIEIVVGSENKANFINKNELIKGRTNQLKYGYEFIVNKAKSNKKAPTLRDLIKEHKAWYDTQMVEVDKLKQKGKECEENWLKVAIKADEASTKAEKITLNGNAEVTLHAAKAAKTDAANIELDAKEAIKILGSMIDIG